MSVVKLAFGQSPEQFQNYTDSDGLPSNSITCIIQDKLGFIWMGTEDGLSRFDGYSFHNYKPIPGDSSSLEYGRISQIIETEDGKFWICFFNRVINLFDPSTGKVNRFYKQNLPFNIKNEKLSSLLVDSKGNFWTIFNGNEIWKSTNSSEGVTNILVNCNPGFRDSIKNSLYEDYSGNIWISSNTGSLYVLYDGVHRNTGLNVEQIRANEIKGIEIKSLFIQGIVQDIHGDYWITASDQVIQTDLYFNLKKKWNIPSTPRTTVCFHKGDVWIGANDGLIIIKKDNSELKHLSFVSNTFNSIPFAFVNFILVDNQQILWLGTHGGLSKLDFSSIKFQHFKIDKFRKEEKFSNRIRAITADESGNVWTGSEPTGIQHFQTKTGNYNNLNYYDQVDHDYGSQSVHSILYLDSLLIFGFSKATILQYNFKKNHFKKIKLDPKLQRILNSSHNTTSLARAGPNKIWIGNSLGLFLVNIKTGTYRHFKFDTDVTQPGSSKKYEVRCILSINDSTVWLGTQLNGLYFLQHNKSKNETTVRNYIPDVNGPVGYGSNTINCIYKQGNEIWLGSYGGGFYNFNIASSKFTKYNTNDGLSNDIVYGILGDSEGNIWISTNRGISNYDPIHKKFTNYSLEDGLQGYEFNSGASFKNLSGWMFFGGTNGWNMFHPDSIKINTYEPEIALTGLQVMNKPVEYGNPILNGKSITYTDTLLLMPDQNFFSLEFVALNFSNTNNNQYKYFLDGFDTQWQTIGTRRFITFTNLSPGSYTLNVQGSNNDGIWSKHIKKLHIKVLPYYYQTSWFKVLLIFLSICIVVFIIVLYRRFYGIRKAVQFKLREQLKQDLHDDLKSDLTAIQSQAELVHRVLSRNDHVKALAKAEEISSLTQNALSTIDDLSWAFGSGSDTLSDLSGRIKNFIVSIIPEEVNYNIISPDEKIDSHISFQKKKQFYLIFKECLQNLKKHSKCKNATFKWALEERNLYFEISDDGIGFDIEKLTHKNGIDHLYHRVAEVSGKIIINTTPGQGTFIKVEIPIT